MIKLNNKKYIALLISSIVIVVVATISITYAYLAYNSTQNGMNTLSTSCYNIQFEDEASINLTSYPMSSETAFRTITPYKFTLSNKGCSIESNYQIILNIKNSTSDNLLPFIDYSLDGTSTMKLRNLTPVDLPSNVVSSDTKASYIIDTGSLANDTTKSFELYLWIDESAEKDIMNSKFQAEVMVYNVAGTLQEETDNPDIPDPEPIITLKDAILANSTKGTGTPNFSKTSCSNGCEEKTVGLYEINVNNQTAYYFRGDINNNYVSFGGYTWRILQIDENGNVKVILDDYIRNNGSIVVQPYKSTNIASNLTNANTLLTFIRDKNDSSVNSPLYGDLNSTSSTNLRGWYNNNLKDYEQNIEDTNFCMDLTGGYATSSGTQSQVYYYGPYQRIGTDVGLYEPTLSCQGTVITEKVGLLSADEYVLAGGASRKANQHFFLYNNQASSWWTLSPAYYDLSQQTVGAFEVLADGSITDWLNADTIVNNGAIRPVITLSGDMAITGNGTFDTPYQQSES